MCKLSEQFGFHEQADSMEREWIDFLSENLHMEVSPQLFWTTAQASTPFTTFGVNDWVHIGYISQL